jgi:hypothetical protein
VPAVDYRFTRLGLDAGFRVSKAVGMFAGFNYRIVNNLGDLGTKFAETKVTAFGGQVGLSYDVLEQLQIQLTGKIDRYAETFIIRTGGDMAQATGTDQFLGAMLGLAWVK